MKATELTKDALFEGLVITTNCEIKFKVTRITEKSFFAVNSNDGNTWSSENRYGLISGIKWFNSIRF